MKLNTATLADASPIPALVLEPNKQKAVERNLAIGYLRAFITLLVLAHHAALAYHPYAPPPPKSLLAQPRWWGAFPVVDAQRWSPFSMFVGFNDIFFMALMFFLSGLFVWQNLQNKGGGIFVLDRFRRLGIPFVIAAVVLAPLAYYPSYLQTGGRGVLGFWQQWRSLGVWPAGPAWFIWLLLAFDCAAAALFALMPRIDDALGRAVSGISRRPIAFFGFLALASAIAYIPMELIFNAISWTGFGPFSFQNSRLLHYAVYFFAGIGVGALGIDRGLLARGAKLAQRWYVWAPASLLSFVVAAALFLATFRPHSSPRVWQVLADMGFVICCATTSLAFLAVFVRFVRGATKTCNSLSVNAYGMYLIHYGFVSWLQYALLPSGMPAVAKGSLVFLGTLALSWITTATLRRIPAVARVI